AQPLLERLVADRQPLEQLAAIEPCRHLRRRERRIGGMPLELEQIDRDGVGLEPDELALGAQHLALLLVEHPAKLADGLAQARARQAFLANAPELANQIGAAAVERR